MSDVFNNPVNNYVYPALSPCVGAGDDSYLEFLPKETIGIVKGSQILAGISFADIKIPVTAYNTNKKILAPGEVTFIQGLDKGIQNRSQGFDLPYLPQNDLNPYFMDIDLSIGFYKGFKYVSLNIEASGNYATNVSIDTALNLALSNALAKVQVQYNPSDLIFTGTLEGWDFNISNVILTLIDASQNSSSPFPAIIIDGERIPQIWTLDEDVSLNILYAKYPNSAMQGIILKGKYPISDSITEYDKWFYLNHVSDLITIYDPIEIDNFLNSINISFDPNIIFGPFIDPEASLGWIDGSIYSELDPPFQAGYAKNCIFNKAIILDSSIYDSSIGDQTFVSNSVLENLSINLYNLDPLVRVEIETTLINDCSINNSVIYDSSIFGSFLLDVSLVRCTLYNCIFDTVTFDRCRNIKINEILDLSTNYLDSSTYYTKSVKSINIGMSCESTSNEMSASDYLEYIDSNGYWNKVGEIYIWTSAPDYTDTENLINGFYLFNPHDFSIELEYLLFV